MATELGQCASPGDRAVICAPQGLEYIVAFLGALQAGLIAVPLSVPLGGAADERVTTSGKVRRGTCVERYRNQEFQLLDVASDS